MMVANVLVCNRYHTVRKHNVDSTVDILLLGSYHAICISMQPAGTIRMKSILWVSLYTNLAMLHILNSLFLWPRKHFDVPMTIKTSYYKTSVLASNHICTISGSACTGNAGDVFPSIKVKENCQLAIAACITARPLRTCRDACRDR